MDEAGTISSTSYRVPYVRNLTIGALVLLGGTVAALPFRRTDDPESDLRSPEFATGPSSAIQAGRELVDFSAAEFVPSNADRMRPPLVTPETSRGLPHRPTEAASVAASTPRMIASNVDAQARRDIRLPLTYQDLAVPVQDPTYIQQRFGALASQSDSASQPAPQAKRIAQPVSQDAFQPLVVRQQIQTEGPTPWQVASNEPVSILQDAPQLDIAPVRPTVPSTQQPLVPGRLASDRHATRPTGTANDSRTRHWIRQPD